MSLNFYELVICICLKNKAPWCGHCQKLSKTLDKVAPYMAGKMTFGKIDCTIEKPLCKRYKVKGFPTIMIYKDGDIFPYSGKRDPDSIINFGERLNTPEVVGPIYSYEDMKKNVLDKNSNGVAFIVYDKNVVCNKNKKTRIHQKYMNIIEKTEVEEMLETTLLLQVFSQVARKLQAVGNFGVLHPSISVEELRKFGIIYNSEYNVSSTLIKIQKNMEPKVYEGNITTPDVLHFIKMNNIPLISTIDSYNIHSFKKYHKRIVIGVFNPDDKTESTMHFIHNFRHVAINHYGLDIRNKNDNRQDFTKLNSYLFAKINGLKSNAFLKSFDVDVNKPDFFVLDLKQSKYWKHNITKTTFSVNDIENFLSAVSDGTIQPMTPINSSFSWNGLFDNLLLTFVEYMPYSFIFVNLTMSLIIYIIVIYI